MGRLRAVLSFARLEGARPLAADAWTKGLRAAIIGDEDPVEARDQMANPNFGTCNRPGTIADQASFDAGLRTHMVRVYNYMASGLALSGIVAFGLFSSAELAGLFFQVQAGRVGGLNILGWGAI